jgi:hypothetical protein
MCTLDVTKTLRMLEYSENSDDEDYEGYSDFLGNNPLDRDLTYTQLIHR